MLTVRKRFSVVVISALILVACGGGDGDDGSGDEWCALAQRIEDKSAEYEASFDVGGDAFAAALADAQAGGRKPSYQSSAQEAGGAGYQIHDFSLAKMKWG